MSGYDYCDESSMTCMKGTDPNGTCNGVASGANCTTKEPKCPTNQTATVDANGCYTGQCEDISACAAAPTCENITDENTCIDQGMRCIATYTGLNCKDPSGQACNSGSTNCTCASFEFAKCVTQSGV
jgi:hypothetical protein